MLQILQDIQNDQNQELIEEENIKGFVPIVKSIQLKIKELIHLNQTHQAHWQTLLRWQRNDNLKKALFSSVFQLSLILAETIFSIFGMNLKNGLDSSANAFWTILGCSIVACIGLLIVINVIIKYPTIMYKHLQKTL